MGFACRRVLFWLCSFRYSYLMTNKIPDQWLLMWNIFRLIATLTYLSYQTLLAFLSLGMRMGQPMLTRSLHYLWTRLLRPDLLEQTSMEIPLFRRTRTGSTMRGELIQITT
ncbi:putative transmembrane protein [Colobopsis shohki virus 1]|nr:putative transmembrane protein [Colobopsis shohki virus 1]